MNDVNIKEILDEVRNEIFMQLIKRNCPDFTDLTRLYIFKNEELNFGGFRGSSGMFWVLVQSGWCRPLSIISEEEIKNPTCDKETLSPEDLSETREVLLELLDKIKTLHDEDRDD